MCTCRFEIMLSVCPPGMMGLGKNSNLEHIFQFWARLKFNSNHHSGLAVSAQAKCVASLA